MKKDNMARRMPWRTASISPPPSDKWADMIRDIEPEIYIDQMTINTQVAGKPLFLTVAKAAIETGYSESYLRKLIQKGALPHFKGEGNNGRVQIRTDELLAFMESRRVINASE